MEDEAGQEDEVRNGKESEGDPEVQEELVVKRGAMSAGVDGERPREGVDPSKRRQESIGHDLGGPDFD